MKLQQIGAALLGLLTATCVYAGNATGKVGKVSVGRLGNQVFIELQAEAYAAWPCTITFSAPLPKSRHQLADFRSVHAKAILGGLHHEYSLARA
jgi:hypothetical protein